MSFLYLSVWVAALIAITTIRQYPAQDNAVLLEERQHPIVWRLSDFDYRNPGYPTNTDGFARGISDELGQCRFLDDTKPHS